MALIMCSFKKNPALHPDQNNKDARVHPTPCSLLPIQFCWSQWGFNTEHDEKRDPLRSSQKPLTN